jgi:hypothetical protein
MTPFDRLLKAVPLDNRMDTMDGPNSRDGLPPSTRWRDGILEVDQSIVNRLHDWSHYSQAINCSVPPYRAKVQKSKTIRTEKFKSCSKIP